MGQAKVGNIASPPFDTLPFRSEHASSRAGEALVLRDIGMFGARHWSAPLMELRGAAHHMRATLSGLRHELVLVHPAPSRSVVLHSADAIAQSTMDQAARLLRVGQVVPC